MKKKVIIIGLIFMSLFTLTACHKGEEKLTDAKRFKEEYESLNDIKRKKDGKKIRSITISDDNPFIYKDASDIVDAINNKETFVVYFGFADCPWCRSVIPTLIEVANDLGLDEIYYVDVKDIRDILEINDQGEISTTKKGSADYYKLLELLKPVLEDYKLTDKDNNEIDTNEKRIYAPNIVSVVQGIPTELESGISKKQTDPYMKLTKEMKRETYNKFKCSIKCVVENNTTCTKDKAC